MIKLDAAELKRPIQTVPEGGLCGDATLIIDRPCSLFLAVFDGAGHGYAAEKAAAKAMRFLKQEQGQVLSDLLVSLHRILKGTSGGVASLCRIDKQTGLLSCAGIGNVSIRLFQPKSYRFITRDGILGDKITRPIMHQMQLNPDDIVMIHSDGIYEHFQATDIPDFFSLDAYSIARITLDYFSRTLDDAGIIVVKVNRD